MIMNTVRGMAADEEFAKPHTEIQNGLVSPLGNYQWIRFRLGLNNVYVSIK